MSYIPRNKKKSTSAMVLTKGILISISFFLLTGLVRAESISGARFSIAMQDRTLDEVFQTLSRESGMEIIYSDELGNQRVYLNLQDVTIEKVLQTVLARKNHTIVYEGGGFIRIEIYGKSAPESGSSAVSMTRPAPRLPRPTSAGLERQTGSKLIPSRINIEIAGESDLTEEEAKILDQRATINPDASVQEKSGPATSFFNLLSGAQKAEPPGKNSRQVIE